MLFYVFVLLGFEIQRATLLIDDDRRDFFRFAVFVYDGIVQLFALYPCVVFGRLIFVFYVVRGYPHDCTRGCDQQDRARKPISQVVPWGCEVEIVDMNKPKLNSEIL